MSTHPTTTDRPAFASDDWFLLWLDEMNACIDDCDEAGIARASMWINRGLAAHGLIVEEFPTPDYCDDTVEPF